MSNHNGNEIQANLYRPTLITKIDSFISVNGGLLLRFNFIWFDTTTFLAYSEEAGSESVMVRASGGLQLASITHVLAALTPNAKKIFLLLARQSCAHRYS
jgi:hypothetical protein